MNLGKSVKRITILSVAPGGQETATEIYTKKRKGKKGSPGLRNLDKITRQVVQANYGRLDTYLDRHRRSNRKRKNGWLRDLPTNALRAQRKGLKQIKPARWF